MKDLEIEVSKYHCPEMKDYSDWWANSPERRELVTRRGPHFLLKSNKPDRRRYRNIHRKREKRANSQKTNKI